MSHMCLGSEFSSFFFFCTFLVVVRSMTFVEGKSDILSPTKSIVDIVWVISVYYQRSIKKATGMTKLNIDPCHMFVFFPVVDPIV